MKQTQAQRHLVSDPNPKHRRISSPAFARARLRRNAAGSSNGKRRGGPTTPLLSWKLEDADLFSDSASESDKESCKGKNAGRIESARKLGAGIWHGNGGLGFQSNVVDPGSSSLHSYSKNDSWSPVLMNYPKNGILHELGASVALPDPKMEQATKWDPGFYSHLKLLEDQQVAAVSDVSSLQSELEHAHSRIAELETEQMLAKKQLEHFVRKLAEEKEAWRRKEHEKIRAVVDSIKDDLHRERKNRKRMEIMNSKLVNELAEAKLFSKRSLQDYEKERKNRELMEEVCDELAKEVGEDKAEAEALKEDSMRIKEEVEEERKMLQMAEVWREERVQMKLVDAKVTLEEKYSQLSKLKAEIEAFIRAKSNSIPNQDKEEAELLRKVADSLKVEDIKEFSYQPPPASEDILAVFEELQPREEPNDRDIEACYGYHNRTIIGCLDKPIEGHANGTVDQSGVLDDADDDENDDSGWETMSHYEEQGSNNSIEGGDPSVNGLCKEYNASVSGKDCDENEDNEKSNSDISEVCSVGTRQSRKKGSSISRLWRSSFKNNNENSNRNSFEAANGRMSASTLSSDGKSSEMGLSSPSVGQWSSPESVNPHIDQGMKGCIEWPRGMQKHSLKAKLLEARIESQKIQLRQALKQKI